MPEGHTIHRAARDLSQVLVEQPVYVMSPQGRFSREAATLDGLHCQSVEAYGKHIVIGFEGSRWLHIHLGLFGHIHSCKLPLRSPKGAVRVRLVSSTHYVDVNGPTICTIINRTGLDHLIGRIGPDVLRDDADAVRAIDRIDKSRAPIGRLLMDQSVIAGIGNIYRTELLWRARIHPNIQGKQIGRENLEALWQDAKKLLKIGVEQNAIITVMDGTRSSSRYGERVNIFGKTNCPTCGCSVHRLEINGRRAFICEICQPLKD
ncbi:MAG: Endonuclease 8 1 [Hyphomicrobiaceae bacterium hypho_1]